MAMRVGSTMLGTLLAVTLSLALGGCPRHACPDPNCTAADCDCGEPNEPNLPAKTLHERIFTDILTDGFTGTADCMICHADVARDLQSTGHWQWAGTSLNIAGFETGTHGKRDLLDNFFLAVPSNEGRCSECHTSFGWRANTPASFFENVDNVDCLVCHDTTGLYRKHPTADGGGGLPALLIQGQVLPATPAQLQQVVYNLGLPNRANCGLCHFYADGGDNVKHGDLASSLQFPSPAYDVHMGGLDFDCQACHVTTAHAIAGFSLYGVDDAAATPDCTRCHTASAVHTANPPLDELLNLHLARVACQSCHIPTFARVRPTQVAWYWSEAGQDLSPLPIDAFGQVTYDKLRGRFVFDENVRPAYRWYDGRWERKLIGVNDTYTEAGTPADPIVLARPTADAATAGAKVYPFKIMLGDQPVDRTAQRLLVPHLFGTGTGLEHPYWESFDWPAALAEGTAYAGQPFDPAGWTVQNGFANTLMYLTLNHEIAPRSQALLCNACHGVPDFWSGLAIPDPLAPQ